MTHAPRIHDRLSTLRTLGMIALLGALLSASACSEQESESSSSEVDSSANTQTGGSGEYIPSGGSGGGASGVTWTDLTFDETLDKAKEDNKMVLVDVWSDHCAQCAVMDEEVWSTAEGVSLVGDAIPIKIPSDARSSYPFRHAYPITGLPAVLLLDSNGNEINRVVGYANRSQWLSEAHVMMSGVDPIPDMETSLESDSENLSLYFPLMEQYLYRTRESEANRLMEKILELDPSDSRGESTKAIRAMAKYYAFFRMDPDGAVTYWKLLVEKFPGSNAITGALKATLDRSKTRGETAQWVEWICGVTNTHPDDGKLQSAVAMYAFRNEVTGACLADAARKAQSLGVAPAGIDTVATYLEGK